MTHPSEGTRVDERLERLLQVERDLEARVRSADEAALAEVAAAREAAQRAERERGGSLEAAERADEEADLEQHAVKLRQITEESAARVARLAGTSESVVDELARRAVATVLGRGGAASS